MLSSADNIFILIMSGIDGEDSLDYSPLDEQDSLVEAMLACREMNHTWLAQMEAATSGSASASEASEGGARLLCPPDFDGISCWLPAEAGVVAVMPCMAELYSIKYDTRGERERERRERRESRDNIPPGGGGEGKKLAIVQ